MKSDADKIREWLDIYCDGELILPAGKKLLFVCRKLLDACEWYGETEYGNKDNRNARKAIEECAKEIEK